MFNGTSAAELKADFREKFRNISKIMDCVGCDKCRLWGKLQVIHRLDSIRHNSVPNSISKKKLYSKQVQGLGTALKILYSGKFDIHLEAEQNYPTVIKESLREKFKLKRGEIVSLFNAFGR